MNNIEKAIDDLQSEVNSTPTRTLIRFGTACRLIIKLARAIQADLDKKPEPTLPPTPTTITLSTPEAVNAFFKAIKK